MKTRSIAFISVLLLAAAPLFAASSAFLKIEGLDGGSKDPAHRGWIELKSFSFGVPQASAPMDTVTLHSTHPAGTARMPSEITITKTVDSASPTLFRAAMTGQHFPGVVLDANGQRYLLQGVTIASVQKTPSGELLTLRYDRDATHEGAMPSGPEQKVIGYKIQKFSANATLNGIGAPASIVLRSVRLVGQNQAIIVVCDAAAGLGLAGLQRAFQTGELVPAVTIATQARKDKWMPTQFTFSNTRITGNVPAGDGCNQMSLKFSRYSGPPSFEALVP